MANLTLAFECKMAWWVVPYLGAVCLFIRSVAPFMDDEERIEAFIQCQAAFVARHGVRFYLGGKRI
ncbi:hypothetical protein [Mesorhizobium sp.]|uniref:hypothetical protein n=1 Tax=Mesorhizobium sp. TaxID=1871066 RepID=UPI000FE6EA2C|nr:hypothetical protein [Mesorhizobium sp.]RWK12532.1 MAG: hypothetical protein EOR39_02735 [Mesorhizobium sp.]